MIEQRKRQKKKNQTTRWKKRPIDCSMKQVSSAVESLKKPRNTKKDTHKV